MRARILLLALTTVAALACADTFFDFAGAQCPCGGGLVCDEASNLCVAELPAATDGGSQVDAGEDAGTPTCPSECPGTSQCDLESGTCVCEEGFELCGEACCRSVRISAGLSHSCLIDDEGKVICWGDNEFGQLGRLPTQGAPNSCESVTVSLPEKAVAVAAGAQHSCALSTGGQVYCWGSNGSGRSNPDDTSGTDILPALFASTSRFVAISTGKQHSCAIRSDGFLRCWGSTEDLPDQLGPVAAVSTGAGSIEHEDPSETLFSDPFVCVIQAAADNAVRCFGSTAWEQVGSFQSKIYLTGAKAVAAGRAHACAITADDKVMCWGQGGRGQLGSLATDDSIDPVLVQGSMGDLINIRHLSAGGDRTCAADQDGEIYCWGAKDCSDAANDVMAMGTQQFGTGLTVGGRHACYFDKDTGAPYCFGKSDKGQAGGECGQCTLEDQGQSVPPTFQP